MSNLAFTTDDGGIAVDAETCRCDSCKNFFWIPKTAVAEYPTFCPFCGIHFSTVSEDDLGDEMRSLYGKEE